MSSREDDEMNPYEVILIVKKRFKIVIGIFIIASLLTGLISYRMKPVYRCSFVLQIPRTGESMSLITPVEILINKLNELIDEKQFKELSLTLGIKEDEVKELVSLKMKNLQDVFVEIIIDVYNPLIIKEFSRVIQQFLNHEQNINKIILFKKESLVNLREDIRSKINESEKLNNIIIARLKHDNMQNLGFNPIEMAGEIADLNLKLIKIEDEINYMQGIEVAVEPVIPQKPYKPKKIILNITIAGITSLFMGIFLVIFLEWLQKSKGRMNQ